MVKLYGNRSSVPVAHRPTGMRRENLAGAQLLFVRQVSSFDDGSD